MMAEDKKAHGLGRRKSAIAQILLSAEPGTRTVNGQPFEVYFPTVAMQKMALKPLDVTSQNDAFGFSIKVLGGGKHGQAGAVALALARALISADEDWHKQLKLAGLLTRDARVKERKKPGLKRARRAPQFSKR